MHVTPFLQSPFLGQFVPGYSGQTSHRLAEKRYRTFTLSLLHFSQIGTGTLAHRNGDSHVVPTGKTGETWSLA